eukprot:2742923-Pyramimonas_sp.AAC.1
MSDSIHEPPSNQMKFETDIGTALVWHDLPTDVCNGSCPCDWLIMEAHGSRARGLQSRPPKDGVESAWVFGALKCE